jgi:hypothetical protein
MIVNEGRQKKPPGCCSQRRAALLACFAVWTLILLTRNPFAMQSSSPVAGITKAAADSCAAKIKRLEAYDAAHNSAVRQTTRFSEAEWNSYLAIVLKPNYHPSLKDIQLKFEEGRLRAVATIDFDSLNFSSTKSLNNLIRSMLTGVHALTVWGRLISDAGKANFQLEEARFDTITLPNLLVVEILSAVGRRQDPPFDPTEPNNLPYHILKVEVHSGYIVVNQ